MDRMKEILILRLEAPLMSFGAPIVDRHGTVQPYPALSMMTGLLGNALGYDHSEPERLERLQERLRYAVRQDRRGRQIQDYQTVDLSKPYMSDNRAWTTRGRLEKRKGGSASTGTHIRLRDYWADAIYTVVLTLDPHDLAPTLGDVSQALLNPARPLFIGRKTCLPATSLHTLCAKADRLRDALQHVPLASQADDERDTYRAWWPSHSKEDRARPVTDRRDWANQIHVGERWIAQGEIEVTANDEN